MKVQRMQGVPIPKAVHPRCALRKLIDEVGIVSLSVGESVRFDLPADEAAPPGNRYRGHQFIHALAREAGIKVAVRKTGDEFQVWRVA